MDVMSSSRRTRKRSTKVHARMLHASAQRMDALSEVQGDHFWTTSAPSTDGCRPISITKSHSGSPWHGTGDLLSWLEKTCPCSS
jgi:hypothetical protein